jgi:cellulose biosynthesis protein BcsQ
VKIALIAKKGGVGKTTLTLLLFEALRQAKKTVRIRDWDAQGTSSRALEFIRPEQGAENSEILLYDTPPNLAHTSTAVAVQDADIVLVVTTPSPADLWEVGEAVAFAEKLNPRAIVRVVFNKVKRTTILGRLSEQGASQIQGTVLSARLSSRECYQHALAQGWRVLDGAAREEVLQLGLAVLSSGPRSHTM